MSVTALENFSPGPFFRYKKIVVLCDPRGPPIVLWVKYFKSMRKEATQ